MNRSIFFRVVLGLIVAAVLVAAGFALFNAGAMYGVQQSPEWARLAEEGGRPDGVGPWMMQGGPGMGFGHWGGWRGSWGMGFGIFGILGFIFQLFLLFIILRFVFGWIFGWRRWGWHGGGPGGWEQRGREKFDEWHKQAHGGGSEPATSTGSEQQSSQ